MSGPDDNALEELGNASTALTVLKAARHAFGWKTAAERLDEAVAESFDEMVSEAAIEWSRFKGQWGGVPPGPTEVRAVVDEARKLHDRTMHAEKRRLIRNAMVNAFDPKVYEAGITRKLMSLLDELDYPEIRALADWASRAKTTIAKIDRLAVEGSFIPHLERLGLLVSIERNSRVPFHPQIILTAQSEKGVATGLPGKVWRTTDLAARMIKFVSEPEEPNGEE